MRKLSRITLGRAAAVLVVSTSLLAATGASAQEAPDNTVSGAATGPGIAVAPTGGVASPGSASTTAAASAESPVETGPGQVVLAVQASQLPKTGGFGFDPALGAVLGVALTGAGFSLRAAAAKGRRRVGR